MYEKKVTVEYYDKKHGLIRKVERSYQYDDKASYINSLRRKVEKRRFMETCKYDQSLPHSSIDDIMDAYEEYIETLKF